MPGMKRRLLYKEYLISASPQKLAASDKWTTNIHIWRDYGSFVDEKSFSAANQWIQKKKPLNTVLILECRL